MFTLEVLGGPLDGKTWEFEHEITIGRDDAVAQACITIDRYISRKHAHLRDEGDRLILTDLSSRNGTSVDGREIAAETSLEPGERFTVGRTVLRATRSGDA
jgi:pSer/pThr/pTyr-binding forkhead associated (FHA) protein